MKTITPSNTSFVVAPAVHDGTFNGIFVQEDKQTVSFSMRSVGGTPYFVRLLVTNFLIGNIVSNLWLRPTLDQKITRLLYFDSDWPDADVERRTAELQQAGYLLFVLEGMPSCTVHAICKRAEYDEADVGVSFK